MPDPNAFVFLNTFTLQGGGFGGSALEDRTAQQVQAPIR